MSESIILSERLCDHLGPAYFLGGFDPWSLWNDRSPLSSLLSLSIDFTLTDTIKLLGAISGHTPLLENLNLAFDIQTHTIKIVERFVSSFDTLKSFECLGYCSLRALRSHARLANLKIYADNLTACWPGWRETPRLNMEDLEQLSVDCPDLRWLELDVQLVDGELVRT